MQRNHKFHFSLVPKTIKNDKTPIIWTPELIANFDECKNSLANATSLVHPKPGAPLALHVDASDYALGGVLLQFNNDLWQPLAFFSQKLSHAQTNYATYDKELLAIYEGIKHFRTSLEGSEFTIFTDHQPLVHAFTKKHENQTPRQNRHLNYISQFSTDIRHVPGKLNVVADALSRIATINHIYSISFDSSLNYKLLAESQMKDPELIDKNSSLKIIKTDYNGSTLFCDISTGQVRPIITPEKRYF